MTTYLSCGTKGGPGKSTFAVNAAALLALEKVDVYLLDADPQGHANDWARRRKAWPKLPQVASGRCAGKEDVKAAMRTLGARHTLIVDVGGFDSDALRAALRLADVAILPFQPSQFDMQSAPVLARMVDEARRFNPDLKTLAFVNAADSPWRSPEGREAHAELCKLEPLRVANTIVPRLAPFRRSTRSGRAVFEMGRAGDKASDGFAALWLEVEEVARG